MGKHDTRFHVRFPPDEWQAVCELQAVLNQPKHDIVRAAVMAAYEAICQTPIDIDCESENQ